MNKPMPPIEDYYPRQLSNPDEVSSAHTSVEILPPHQPDRDPVALVQELCECNQTLLMRIANLELSLEQCQQKLLAAQPANAEPAAELEVSEDTRASLAIAHEVADQQQHLITILAEQLEANLKRVAEFERDAAFNQQRHREQSSRLVQYEQDIKTLQSRLQRQQYYSLQLKAALEKTVRHNQVDPIWLERVWNQLAKEGGFTASSAAIASWSQNSPDSPFPTPSELEAWLDNLSQDTSPWTASEVLFAEEVTEPAEQDPAAVFMAETPAESQEHLKAADESPSPTRPPTKPQNDIGLPALVKPSCSFNLVEPTDVNAPPKKSKLPSAPDLPSFLKPRQH